MRIIVPELSLVVIVGASGSGKSTFCAKHFRSTEVLSSDYFRALVSDDENDQSVTKEAFEALHFVLSQRLKLGRVAVIDATNTRPEDRKALIEIARAYHCIPVAIVLNLPDRVCHERNRSRPDRSFGEHVVRNQTAAIKRSLRGLKREGFRQIYILDSAEEVAAVEIERQPLWCNKKHERGPFDIIGDLHGCFDELLELLAALGYRAEPDEQYPFGRGYRVTHPHGRKPVFLGDLVDRGPKVVEVLRLVMSMTHDRAAWCVPGNHDLKLVKKLRGKDVQLRHGLAETLAQLEPESDQFKDYVRDYLDTLVSHYVLDGGKLVVAHAGMREEYQGRGSSRVRAFAMFGETTGETDEFGLPVRYNWAEEYRGNAMVVYGHTPVPEPEWLNRTINIDTGCVFGGSLTALQYPEREIVSVPSHRVYAEPARPLLRPGDTNLSLQQRSDDMLDIDDVYGKRFIRTRFRTSVTIREENAAAALEVMSRFAANPKWLIYLPPTMSPSETSRREGFLEHPAEALGYFSANGIRQVICEEKHMGSRAAVVICRTADAAQARFGVTDGSIGICYTRTGRRFLAEPELVRAMLERLQQALSAAEIWSRLETDWVLLDCELMPWSLKAQELLRSQYAAVGSSGRASLETAEQLLARGAARVDDLDPLLQKVRSRQELVTAFVAAYRRYCWTVRSLEDLKLAPFHILASEGAVHTDRSHRWHMEEIGRICDHDSTLLQRTQWMIADVEEEAERARVEDWWMTLTQTGGEGMVVKPLEFAPQTKRGLIQPAVKCRGREYLRIIYGPEYTAPEHIERLRARGLSAKRSLALREFALGIEGLQRFVEREPLRKVHECVFGVLALESEPVDPRL